MNNPILLLQMQRMGDLVLTFPLMIWLARTHPGREIWVVAEPAFYDELYRIAPGAVFFPWDGADRLAKARDYHLVVNLSHRPEAAELAGKVRAERKIGPVAGPGGTRIFGDWQLYRASLVGTNRHNQFHWADLNGLDVVDAGLIAATNWQEPGAKAPGEGRVGLFLGASEASKRPDPEFYAGLARALYRRGLKPILFGGPAEARAGLGAEVRRLARAPLLDLSGKLRLEEFVRLCPTLDLFVTPDTGPMHVAAWAGTRVLNLSIGPVHPWETGPYQPGNLVLRPRISCDGCWSCRWDEPVCRARLSPERVAPVVAAAAGADAMRRTAGLKPRGFGLRRSVRAADGLYDLEPTAPGVAPTAREMTARFWRAYFERVLERPGGAGREEDPGAAFARLAASHPGVAEGLARRLPAFGTALARLARDASGLLPGAFWKESPLMLRPLASFSQLLLDNADYAPEARRRAVALFEILAACVRPSA